MEKSECYLLAMLAVLEKNSMYAGDKLDVLEVLMADRRVALWSEKEEEKNGL